MDKYRYWYETIEDVSMELENWIKNINIMPQNPVIVFSLKGVLIDSQGYIMGPIKKIYDKIIDMGIKAMIISDGESAKKNISYVQRYLQTMGIWGYNRIYFRKPYMYNDYEYKLNIRKKLTEEGNTILMCIGTMPWDVGYYGGKSVILPIFTTNKFIPPPLAYK